MLLAEYRGTEVAVKRVLPPSEKKQKRKTNVGAAGSGSDDRVVRETMSQWFTDDVESANTPSSLFSATGLKSSSLDDKNTSGKAGVVIENSGNRRQLKKEFIQEMRLLATLRHPW